MNKREFISVASTLPAMLSFLATSTWAQTSQGQYEGMPSLLRPEDDPEFGPIITGKPSGGAVVGTARSTHAEIRQAVRIILDAPRAIDLVDTAMYFANLAQTNADGDRFSEEWSDRANPLIVAFFALTGTAPSDGDQTHWCAAFLSFCLFLANKPNKYTALSGGYRRFGRDSTNNPSRGDIAVFSRRGDAGRQGFGHVGLYLSSESQNGVDGIRVLGGNQVGATGSTGAITASWYARDGGNLFLHSIRRVE